MSKEYYIYGVNRLGYMEDRTYIAKKASGKSVGGVATLPTQIFANIPNPFVFVGTTSVVPVYFGKKRYELSDWLGNVRVVVNDRKTPVNSGTVTLTYRPQVVSVADYYAFGSQISERSYDPVKPQYRFGFNGHERDDEVKGEGNYLSFGDYGYDTRIGNRWSIEPKFMKYSCWSSYVVLGRNPIKYVDRDGCEIVDSNGNRAVEIREGKIMFTEYATEDIKTVVNAMMLTKVGTEQVKAMIEVENKIQIIIDRESSGFFNKEGVLVPENSKDIVEENYGITQTINFHDDKTKLPDSKITIFLKTIQRSRSDKNYYENIGGKKVFLSDFSEEEVIGGIAIHESVHATDKESNRNVMPKPMYPEKKPKERELEYYMEIQRRDSKKEKSIIE